MKRLRLLLTAFNADKRGITALEYGMIAALVAVIAISGFTGVGKGVSSRLSSINTAL